MIKKCAFSILFVSLLVTGNLYANEAEVYICPVDSVYKVSAGRSLDMDGGELEITINGDDVVVKNSRIEGFGTHHLMLKVKSGYQIKALNKSMIFMYSVNSKTFVLHTGIGPSGFSYTSGGHTGRQMRVSGLCSKN